MAVAEVAANEPQNIVVENAEQFRKMPEEYQQLATRLMLVHTEGELSGVNDYLEVFFPMAPNAYEKMICCERAAEEMDHYIRGAAVLAELGIDTSYMLNQSLKERTYYANDFVRDVRTWMERGMFSFLGEASVLDHIFELAQFSYKPFANIFDKIIADERVHIAHGLRIVRDACKADDTRAEAQAALDRFWPIVLDLFGRSDSKRNGLYRKWGLRKTANDELRQAFIARMRPRIEALGLKVPPDDLNRKFV